MANNMLIVNILSLKGQGSIRRIDIFYKLWCPYGDKKQEAVSAMQLFTHTNCHRTNIFVQLGDLKAKKAFSEWPQYQIAVNSVGTFLLNVLTLEINPSSSKNFYREQTFKF